MYVSVQTERKWLRKKTQMRMCADTLVNDKVFYLVKPRTQYFLNTNLENDSHLPVLSSIVKMSLEDIWITSLTRHPKSLYVFLTVVFYDHPSVLIFRKIYKLLIKWSPKKCKHNLKINLSFPTFTILAYTVIDISAEYRAAQDDAEPNVWFLFNDLNTHIRVSHHLQYFQRQLGLTDIKASI